MDMRLGTPVEGTDGRIGHLSTVVIDPQTDDINSIVVTAEGTGNVDRLVAESHVREIHEDRLVVDLSKHEFFDLPAFTRPRYVNPDAVKLNTTTSVVNERAGWHYALTGHVPSGMAACPRDMPVHDADGKRIGKLDWLVIDAEHDHVSHIVLSEGHLFTKKDIAVPVAHVTSLSDGRATLDLTADEVEALPPV